MIRSSHLAPPACGDLRDVETVVTDPFGIAILGIYGLMGAAAAGAIGWMAGWPVGKSALVGGGIPIVGLLAYVALQPSKPKPQPVSFYGYR